jgi:hypothetical protein
MIKKKTAGVWHDDTCNAIQQEYILGFRSGPP